MAIWARAALVLSVLFFVPRLREDFEGPKAAVVRVLGLGALAAAAASWRRLRQVAWTPLDLAVFAWVAVEILCTAASAAPVLSLVGEHVQRDGLLTTLAVFGFYLALRSAGGANRVPAGAGRADGVAEARLMMQIAIGAATVTCAYALLQAAGLDPLGWAAPVVGGWRQTEGRPFGTLGHPNLLGVVGAAAATAAWALVAAPGGRRWLHAGAGAICVAATAVTLSRAAWLGMLAGMAVVALATARAGTGRSRRRTLLMGIVIVGMVAVVLIAGGWGGRLMARFGELLHPTGGSGASRLEIWRGALRAWSVRPWLGWGPDTFAAVFPRFQTAEYWRYEWGGLPFHAHSIYLQTLATRGLLGCAAGLAWAVAALAAARAVWRRGGPARAILPALLGALAALACAGGFGALGAAGNLLVTIFSALLANLVHPAGARDTGGSRARVSSEGASSRPALAAGLLVAITAAAWGAADLAGSRASAEAQVSLERAMETGGGAAAAAFRTRALEAARRAASLSPADDLIADQCADALLASAEISARPAPLLLEATAEVRRALRLVPIRAESHLQLGRVLATRAAYGGTALGPEAVAALERAAALAPASTPVLDECARVALALGRIDQALALARRATSLYPEDGPSLALLASISARTGDTAAAVEALRRAVGGEWHGDEAGRADARRRLEGLEHLGRP